MLKKLLLLVAVFVVGVMMINPPTVQAYNFGDYRSVTLVTKAWESLAKKDLEAVLAYSNKCIELYANQAKKMEASLTDYAKGSNDEIFAYWALNDVATAYYIQGEAYRQAEMKDEAKSAYQKVVDEYTYGQCWDNGGWFWKPAAASKEKIAIMESGSNIDFGDYRSETLAGKAWKALENNDFVAVKTYADKCLELYEAKAKEMQNSLTEYPWESPEKIFSYWALNDVGTILFIQGEALKKDNKTDEAQKAYKRVVDEFYYAQCWDPKGWFWKPAEAAQQKLDEIKEDNKT